MCTVINLELFTSLVMFRGHPKILAMFPKQLYVSKLTIEDIISSQWNRSAIVNELIL